MSRCHLVSAAEIRAARLVQILGTIDPVTGVPVREWICEAYPTARRRDEGAVTTWSVDGKPVPNNDAGAVANALNSQAQRNARAALSNPARNALTPAES